MSAPLPIYDVAELVTERLQSHRRLILQAPTGSGKSTQIPQILLRAGLLGEGRCVVLQPRRLAARMLAARVASELGVALGQEVGYQVRFDNVTSARTRIKFETEGILLRQLTADSSLRGITAVVFDEFHERHLYGDITLARVLDLQETLRPDLRVIVMSATLNTSELQGYLDRVQNAPVQGALPPSATAVHVQALQRGAAMVTSAGRTFPVSIEYLNQRVGLNGPPPWELAARAFAENFKKAQGGDVLIFMPGGYEIQQTIAALKPLPEARGWMIAPLHGELSPREQDAAVARQSQPKIVVATNVAETSLTIDGVCLVIDSGLARIARYDANRGLNTLLVERISQASADQRAGRAGRTAPGVCVRLWAPSEHAERAPQELPEVRRLDLAEVILTLKAAGIDNLRRFRWLEKPDEIALTHAERLLVDLGALEAPSDGTGVPGGITDIGRRMLAFPLHPRYARMLVAASEHGCVYHACQVAALTQGRDLLPRSPDREVERAREDAFGDCAGSDFWVLMKAWEFAVRCQFRNEDCRRLGINAQSARQVGPLLEQFLRIARDEGLSTEKGALDDRALRTCLLLGFSDRLARRIDPVSARCDLTHGRRGTLVAESVVRDASLLVAAEVRETSVRGDVATLLSLASAVEPDWIIEWFPNEITAEIEVQWDPNLKRVTAIEWLRFRGLPIDSRRIEPPPADRAAALLAAEVIAGRLDLPRWDDEVEVWLRRLRFLCQHCPDLQLPAITPEDRESLILELCNGVITSKDLREREVLPVVSSWLSGPQRGLLDKHAPERLRLPNGKSPKVHYEEGIAPYISLRIQELYDVETTPRIAMGRVPVVVHILTPGMKPIQVTADLASFWKEHYPKIKAQLQRRYPRHLWR